MTSRERVAATFDFRPLDYVALYDQYWGGFVSAWQREHNLPVRGELLYDDIIFNDMELRAHYHIDMFKAIPVEDPWPSKASIIKKNGSNLLVRDGWGRVIERLTASNYGTPLNVAIEDKKQLDALEFEPAESDIRFTKMLDNVAAAQRVIQEPYIFIKIGGPYLRASFLRGELQWYMDLLEDSEFAKELAARITDHLIAVALEAWNRIGVVADGIWIFDDIAANYGLLMPPSVYEEIFVPHIRRMVKAFKQVGVKHVGFHSDGDVRAILDALVDAGISIMNPVEPRAGMNVVELRNKFGKRLSFCGGLCNSQILPWGTDDEVRRHVEHVMSIAQEGGLVIGSHSTSQDISVSRYDFIMKILHEHGRPLPGNTRVN